MDYQPSKPRFLLFSLVWILLLISTTVFTQDLAEYTNKQFGLDQIWCNGKRYSYTPATGVHGNQYLVSPEFLPGSLTINEQMYEHLIINYDILNQQVLLKYRDGIGAMNILEVPKGWVSGFQMGDKQFTIYPQGSELTVYQTIGTGTTKILYQWSKTIKLSTSMIGTPDFSFTQPVRKAYLSHQGKRSSYSSKKGFLNTFDPETRDRIRLYLKEHRINFKKATDTDLMLLLHFIDGVY